MNRKELINTYGFRFLDTLNGPFCQLFAIGYDIVKRGSAYDWDGLKRIDGPLLLFQYTLSGVGEIIINDIPHQVGAGTAFMVDIPSKHRYYLPEESDSWEFYFILIRPTNIYEQWIELVNQLGNVYKIHDHHLIIQFIKNTYFSARMNYITDGYQASSIVYQFIMELYRFANEYKKEKHSWPLKVREAVMYMEENYKEIQSLEELASAVGLSKYHFTRIFKNATGLTPIEYLTKVKMEKSVTLLRQSNLTIDEIAKQVGYSNGSYFIKVFKKWLGFSPGEFRLGKDLAVVNQLKFD
ncbi:AraC family transcriptional regulator [Metabacillus malikii]|uniref:AraC-like DNA-binding protein n=1 Tax=Metabacillus malikii TaxID=1504265 RepID=A0ABT9ZM17_9BACI|nr:helix-turn-helix domain-containing protein [Metabacillus malikii]MDQ0232563.1 AraC-like DNA-binding protein [Metabacillus malikii]